MSTEIMVERCFAHLTNHESFPRIAYKIFRSLAAFGPFVSKSLSKIRSSTLFARRTCRRNMKMLPYTPSARGPKTYVSGNGAAYSSARPSSPRTERPIVRSLSLVLCRKEKRTREGVIHPLLDEGPALMTSLKEVFKKWKSVHGLRESIWEKT